MPRQNTGTVRLRRGTWYARLTLDAGERPSIPLPTCTTEKQALKRLALLITLAGKLRRAGHTALAADFLSRAAARELRRPFQCEPDFGVTSVNYDFAELLSRAEAPR